VALGTSLATGTIRDREARRGDPVVIDRSPTRARVLVVDDERGPRESLRMILSPTYDVVLVASGAEALEILHTTPVDVVTLDLAMPGLRGQELMRAIRLDFPDVEVIVITGHGSLESATDAIRHGICDYLQKPFDVVQVTAAVYRALTRRRGRRRLVTFLEELANVVGRDVHVADILDQVETDTGLRNRLGEILARSAAEFAPAPAVEPEHTLPFFEVLADAIESQDPFMRGHARRTAFYATLLADRLCLSETDKRQVRLAAFLHDIGKIGVPSALLSHTGPLAVKDRNAIERHPEVGARLIAPLGVSPGLVAAVRHHHERWDGTGYPDHLAGESIPLTARIVQIADAFDAMTGGTRPDRPGRSRAEAVRELSQCAGTQFDPTLVKEFAVVAEGATGEVDLDLVADLVASTRSVSESAVPSSLQSDQRGAP
jgi:putative two-component system response regulator